MSVKYQDPYKQRAHDIPYIVRWDHEGACFECVNYLNFMYPSVLNRMEIVGNKWNNPELLKDVN